MRPLLASVFLLSTGLGAQSVTLNLGDLRKAKNIVLVSDKGAPTELVPGDYAMVFSTTFGATFTIDLGPSVPSVSPTAIHYGENDPTKGTNICFVKLTEEKGKLKGKVKKGFSGNTTHPDSSPFGEKKGPEPVKQADGSYTLTLTEPLPPGYYGFLSSKKAWVFQVLAK